jgi:glycine hydroxymethyltransferase
LDPSWIRLWTPAITTRWLGEKEMKEIARIINIGLNNHENEIILKWLKKEIQLICKKFPLNY